MNRICTMNFKDQCRLLYEDKCHATEEIMHRCRALNSAIPPAPVSDIPCRHKSICMSDQSDQCRDADRCDRYEDSDSEDDPGDNKYSKIKHEVTNLINLLAVKQKAYGNSFGKSGGILEILYPDGVGVDQYTDLLTVTRVVDKLFRIANKKDAFDENPWQDIAGYALLSVVKFKPCSVSSELDQHSLDTEARRLWSDHESYAKVTDFRIKHWFELSENGKRCIHSALDELTSLAKNNEKE